MSNSSDDLKGIGGWLSFVAIGVVLYPFDFATSVLKIFEPILTQNLLEVLSDPNSPAYNPALKNLVLAEIFFNIIIFLISVVMLFVFFTKKAVFPKVFIFLHLFHFSFYCLDLIVASYIMPNDKIVGDEEIKAIIQKLAMVLIWVPYMIKSVRVKNTFVN